MFSIKRGRRGPQGVSVAEFNVGPFIAHELSAAQKKSLQSCLQHAELLLMVLVSSKTRFPRRRIGQLRDALERVGVHLDELEINSF